MRGVRGGRISVPGGPGRAVRWSGRRRRAAALSRLLAAAGICGAVLLAAGLAVKSGLFRIGDTAAVEVSGNRLVPRSEIIDRSGIRPGLDLFSIDTGAAAAGIAAHPWVAAARVSRRWPDRIVISVRERVPVALVVRGGGLAYVDGRAEVFAPAGPPAGLDYPVITGAATGAGLARAVGFIRGVDRDDPVFPRQILSEVHVDRDGGLTMFLADNPFPVRVGRGPGGAERFAAVLKHLCRRNLLAVTRFVDLDYGDDKVLVRLALPAART